MSKYSIDGQTLTDIADAIREKTGDTAALTAAAMAEAIASISGGGGGLEYESGEWSGNGQNKANIPFTNQHDTPPTLFCVAPVEELQNNEPVMVAYTYVADVVGTHVSYSGNSYYGIVTYPGIGGGSLYTASVLLVHSKDESGDRNYYPSYWCSNSALTPYTGGSSRYWQYQKRYKWIAIWL